MSPITNIYIEYDGVSYFFKDTSITDINMLYDKYWFIIKNKNNENVNQLADIWLMKKHYGLTYPAHIEKQLESCKLV